jgi:DNA/RNA-binding domain of Phe-tRNA-synthetase-like protein
MNQLDDFEFVVNDDVPEAGVSVGFLLLSGIENRLSNPEFISVRANFLSEIIANDILSNVVSDPKISGYRELHQRFSVNDSTLVPSSESLYLLLFKRGDLYPINALVDIYNYVSLKCRVLCGANDIDHLDAAIRLSTTTGTECFIPLGNKKEQRLPRGEYTYLDGSGRVIFRLECKQTDHSAVTEATRNAVIIVPGNAQTICSLIDTALAVITALVERYIGKSMRLRQEIISHYVAETIQVGSHGG